jgi:hypothetical protein
MFSIKKNRCFHMMKNIVSIVTNHDTLRKKYIISVFNCLINIQYNTDAKIPKLGS